MNLESFAEKINRLSEIENYEKRDNVTVDQAGFTVKKNEMVWKLFKRKSFVNSTIRDFLF